MSTNSVSEPRLVAGLQPVREALKVHGSAVTRVAVDARPLPRLDAIARFATDRGAARVDRVGRDALDALTGGLSHQGVVAWVPRLHFTDLHTVLAMPGLLALAVDEIQDTQNFGAVVRSAVGLAGAPIIWGEHASAPLSPAMFRASAGAIEHAILCRVSSLRGALDQARARDLQVVGLDAQAELSLSSVDLTLPTVLVLGSEHKGMARGVRKACTHTVKLAGRSAIDSLNASVAAGIALYEAWKQRNFAELNSGSSCEIEGTPKY